VAVELAVTLPLPVAEAAAVGTAELVGAAGWVLCGRVAGSDSAAHLPEPATGLHGSRARRAVARVPKPPCSPPREGQGGGKRSWFWISRKAVCARADALQQSWGAALLWPSGIKPPPLPLLAPCHPALTSSPVWMMNTLPGSRLKAQETQCGCQGPCYRTHGPRCPPRPHGHPPHSGDSSEPSPQSSSWSQTKCLGMHWRFPHMNSRSSHVLLYTAVRHRCQPLARLRALLPPPQALHLGVLRTRAEAQPPWGRDSRSFAPSLSPGLCPRPAAANSTRATRCLRLLLRRTTLLLLLTARGRPPDVPGPRSAVTTALQFPPASLAGRWPGRGTPSSTDRDLGEGGWPPPAALPALLCSPPQPLPRHAPSPPGTHSSRQRGSHQRRPHSPCPRHRASAPAHTRRCLGTGRILCCRWSALGKGEAGRRPVTPTAAEMAPPGYMPPPSQGGTKIQNPGEQ